MLSIVSMLSTVAMLSSVYAVYVVYALYSVYSVYSVYRVSVDIIFMRVYWLYTHHIHALIHWDRAHKYACYCNYMYIDFQQYLLAIDYFFDENQWKVIESCLIDQVHWFPISNWLIVIDWFQLVLILIDWLITDCTCQVFLCMPAPSCLSISLPICLCLCTSLHVFLLSIFAAVQYMFLFKNSFHDALGNYFWGGGKQTPLKVDNFERGTCAPQVSYYA